MESLRKDAFLKSKLFLIFYRIWLDRSNMAIGASFPLKNKHTQAFPWDYLHSVSGSRTRLTPGLVAPGTAPSPLSSLARLLRRILRRRKEPWPCELGPRFRKGLPWVMRAPRFSSSP